MTTTPNVGRRGHEPDISSVRGIVWVFFALFAGVALVLVAAALFMGLFSRPRGEPVILSERAFEELAATEHWSERGEDLEAVHAEEDEHLHGYGWIDRTEGRVHIPITRAMDLVAAEGWPRPAGDATAPGARRAEGGADGE